MSLRSGFSSLDELNSCNLKGSHISQNNDSNAKKKKKVLYREDIRLKTALKLLTLRANNTLEAKAFNWFTMAFSFGRSKLQEKDCTKRCRKRCFTVLPMNWHISLNNSFTFMASSNFVVSLGWALRHLSKVSRTMSRDS